MLNAIAVAAVLLTAPGGSPERAPAVLRAVADNFEELRALRWGESIEHVKVELSKRYALTDERDVGGTRVMNFDVTFAELGKGSLDVEFQGAGGLSDLCVSFDPSVASDAIGLWRSLLASMSTRYGAPTTPAPAFAAYSDLFKHPPGSTSARWVAEKKATILSAVRDGEWEPRATWTFGRAAECRLSLLVAVDDARTGHISTAIANACCSAPQTSH